MLYKRYRPRNFDEIYGNDQTVELLEQAMARPPKERPHVMLFHGPPGCGKTTTARIVAEMVGAGSQFGLREMNAANTRGIETVRAVVQDAVQLPIDTDVQVFLFDESQQLTGAAQEALYKVVEECPDHTYFIFCTTNPSRIRKPIRDRAACYEFRTLRDNDIIEMLKHVADKASLLLNFKDFGLIAEAAEGCPREALVILEQVYESDLPAEEVIDSVCMGAGEGSGIRELCQVVVSRRKGRWQDAMAILDDLDEEPERVRLGLLGYTRRCLLRAKSQKDAIHYAEIIRCLAENTYASGQAGLALMVFDACQEE